ncbi:carboxymuconolactone decarboxylase family protein [Sulfurospirillum arsenophilum]|uniref:carboxymuconolactone decarboxylase family protein n=1 Tax=Sulfurospirillum arsenophilum TaxID=56698 RepID=UPI0005A685EA|nr:carboxymuconolactone decarboxylase family protein [Sulfurospirillum arsenophilum]
MKQALWAILAIVFIGFIPFLEAKEMLENALTPKQQSIITISAFTANGDLEKLKSALIQGLDAGLSVNEIKEILVHLYAYTGFPRSLNGINTFMTVINERQAKGIKDTMGKEATALPSNFNKDEYGARVRAELLGQKEIPSPSSYQLFAPTIDTFLKEHLFADIFARDILDYQTRELVTISALASMMGTAPQLQAHLGIALNMGLAKEQLEAFTAVLKKEVGDQEAQSAHDVLTIVLKNRKL